MPHAPEKVHESAQPGVYNVVNESGVQSVVPRGKASALWRAGKLVATGANRVTSAGRQVRGSALHPRCRRAHGTDGFSGRGESRAWLCAQRRCTVRTCSEVDSLLRILCDGSRHSERAEWYGHFAGIG